jgi:hypothetical protein
MVFVVAGTFKFNNDNMSEVHRLVITFRDWAKVTFPDVSIFHLSVDITDPHAIYIYEEWTSAEANAVMNSSVEHDDLIKHLGPFLAGPPDVKMYNKAE